MPTGKQHQSTGESGESGLSESIGPADASLGAMTPEAEAVVSMLETLKASNAVLQTLAANYEAALDNISRGVCVFDGNERLVLCNTRYAQIYRLTLDEVKPGTTFSEIMQRLVTAGTATMMDECHLAEARSIIKAAGSKTWVAELPDGRTIQIGHQTMPDGGWVATHEDITELKATRSVANERLSLQALIDCLPDYLWVKDSDGRFVVLNKALALDSGRVRTSDMIGLTDFDLHPYDVALEFRASELGILRSGQTIVDREEMVFDAAGKKRWLLSTKVPLLDEQGNSIGLVGCARDITARKLASLLREGQAKLLEDMATNAPLNSILEQIAALIEFRLSGVFCVIMLLDEGGAFLKLGAAPSLGDMFANPSDGIRIGPKAASCGTAIFRKEPVIVTDIAVDPLWGDYQHLAADYQLKSCWSKPIMTRSGDALGTIAMYSLVNRGPDADEEALAKFAVHLAGIAIYQKINGERLRNATKNVQQTKDAAVGLKIDLR